MGMRVSIDVARRHLLSRMALPGSGWTNTTALTSRIGLFAPRLRLDAPRDGSPFKTPFCTTSVVGNAGQMHAALLETVLWRLDGRPRRMNDGSLALRARMYDVQQDLSGSANSYSGEQIIKMLDDLKDASFALHDLKKPWGGVETNISGTFLSSWDIKEVKKKSPLRKKVVNEKKGQKVCINDGKQKVLIVVISDAFRKLLSQDSVRLCQCRLPIVRMRSSYAQALARWVMSQNPRKPPKGGWYSARTRIRERILATSVKERSLDTIIARVKADDPMLFRLCGIDVDASPKGDCRLRLMSLDERNAYVRQVYERFWGDPGSRDCGGLFLAESA